jgi:hypothetical protein
VIAVSRERGGGERAGDDGGEDELAERGGHGLLRFFPPEE